MLKELAEYCADPAEKEQLKLMASTSPEGIFFLLIRLEKSLLNENFHFRQSFISKMDH